MQRHDLQIQEPIGENRLTLALKHAALDRHNAKIMAQIARETDPDTPLRETTISHLGDERQLRGIPVVGAPGVGGAINGTNPGR